MLRMAQMISPEDNAKVLSAALQAFEHGGDHLLVGQSLSGVKNRRETGFEINHAVPAQVFGLFVGDALQRFFGLHHGDGVSEAFQIFGQAALVRALMEPLAPALPDLWWEARGTSRCLPDQSRFAAAARHPDARAIELSANFRSNPYRALYNGLHGSACQAYSSPISSFHTSGFARMYSAEQRSALFGIEVDHLHAERAQPLHSALKVAALADHHRSEAKLPYQPAAIPARRECSDHDEIAIAALASGVAEGIGFAVHGGIAILHAPVMTSADEMAVASKIAAPIGIPPSASPLRASAKATASMAG